MKRKDAPSAKQSPAKKARPEVPDYLATPMLRDDDGEYIWPAPRDQIQQARDIIRECAAANAPTVICPDKDADGLTSGVILARTLELLGLAPDLIHVHLLSKGTTVHSPAERAAISAHNPRYIFVLDQGSRSSPALAPPPCTTLVIDHHYATPTDFPAGSQHVSACHSPPVATTSLLTYHICLPLHPDVNEADWLCIVGTQGDLGALTWTPPFPDMSAPMKRHTKKALAAVVSAVNAPRRTARYDVISAWTALRSATRPADVLAHQRLHEARAEVAAEVERVTHTAPRFTPDGAVAVFRIRSGAQVHPVIATRWAGHLNSKALRIVMVANEGYLEGKVNFSCRVARCARARGEEVDIIQALRGYAATTPVDGGVPLLQRVGDDFARGHVQASGGIIGKEEFEELMAIMRVGEKSDAAKAKENESPKKVKGKIDAGQTNTLMGYFGKKTSA